MFLDESGVTTEMTRRYGWAPRPERVWEAVPAGHWRLLTVLAALTTQGVLASMTIESPTDGDVFFAFLEQVLAPKLEPGHIVILDNLGAHKIPRASADRKPRRTVAVSAALFARLQPHRAGLGQAETAAAWGQGASRGALGVACHRSPHHHHRGSCPRLLPPLRLRDTTTMKLL